MQRKARRRKVNEEDSLGIIACLRSSPNQKRVRAAIREFLQSPVNARPSLDFSQQRRGLKKTEERCAT